MKTTERKIAEYKTLKQIVDQLRSCGYECEAGKLVNNIAFLALERMAENETTK